MSNIDQFVDSVYSELERLNAKDINFKKNLLGNEPIKKIFDIYSEWLANNTTLSPKVAANTIYKDVIGVGYIDFANRKVKRGMQVNDTPSFNLVFGTQKEIDEAAKIMNQLKTENPAKYNLVYAALEKVRALSDTVKPAKNIFGKTTNVAKQSIMNFKMPRLGTLLTFLKMNDNQLKAYIQKIEQSMPKPKSNPVAPQVP